MLIVAVDTSGKKGSVALCRGDGEQFEVLQREPLEGGTYSALLMPRISQVLAAQNLHKQQIDGFVVVSGPGSFTGLRVGLATVKGLCEVLRRPLATLSMLEALAVTHSRPGNRVTAVLDAGRGEVFAGDYGVVSATKAEALREYIAKTDAFVDEAVCAGVPVLTPDSKVAEAVQARGCPVTLVAPVQADGIARIGMHKLIAGDVVDYAAFDANYIRRSDAEIFSAPKR